MEVHRRGRLRPREVYILLEALGSGHAVLKRALVEHVRWEFGEARVHTVLHLKADGTVAEEDEAFEEGLGETSPSSLLVHDRRTELRVI